MTIFTGLAGRDGQKCQGMLLPWSAPRMNFSCVPSRTPVARRLRDSGWMILTTPPPPSPRQEDQKLCCHLVDEYASHLLRRQLEECGRSLIVRFTFLEPGLAMPEKISQRHLQVRSGESGPETEV